MSNKIKVYRQARNITVQGGDNVYTRYSRKEYESRRQIFADPDAYNTPAHLADYSYDEWTEWGAMGGRPRKWADDAQRMRAKRAQQKLATGQPLTPQEREILGLIKRRPGAYQSPLGRPMTPAERQRARRARLKGTNHA